MTAQIPTNMPPNDPTDREASSPENDDPDDLNLLSDMLRPPRRATPFQPEPDASPAELPRFPRLLKIVSTSMHLHRSPIVTQVIRELDPQVRARLSSACRALQRSEGRLVATCISVGLMARIVADDPDLEDELTMNVAVTAFHRGFAAISG
ncbi:hypothetical protein WME73_34515 [Sorangium sp. So ce302]|uniref:hypothetical protein n=1 Tax=unclassified Sorangium TaxID=2621164 RepID=UPI003F62D0A4